MPITAEYRPGYATVSTGLRVELDGWGAGSPGDVDNQGTAWYLGQPGIEGWHEAPAPRLSLTPRPGEHGASDGPAFLDPRVITISGHAFAVDRASARRARDIVASVCGDPSLGLQTLTVTASGNPTRQVAVRRSAETKTRFMGGGTGVEWSMVLTAPDPRRYAASLTTQQIGLPQAGGGGLVFPLVFPLTFGTGSSGGEMTLVNTGTLATWPTWTVLGPATGPIITNATTGEALTFDPTFVVPAGQNLIIDTDAKTVRLQGINRRDRLFGAGWFRLNPGSSVIRFTSVGSFDAATRLTGSYREAWT
jgi:hypothetical protein